MPLASHVSLQLARFTTLRTSTDVDLSVAPDALFLNVAADVRAAATDLASRQAFVFLLFGLHADADSAHRAIEAGTQIAPFLSEAAESWHAVLKPFRHAGEANFLSEQEPGPLFDVRESQPDTSQPIVVLTSAGYHLGPDLDMQRVRDFGTGVLGVRASMTGLSGLTAQHSFFFPDVLRQDALTVTIWRDFAAMRDFAYGPGSHRRQLDRHKAASMVDRTSFTRCTIERSTGTWYGWSPEARALTG